MNELVLNLITAYEDGISTVNELVTTAYQATAHVENFAEFAKEKERLKAGLQEALAKNCSLRRKDFDGLIQRLLFDSEQKGKEIEAEQRRMREKLQEYLDEQRELAVSLKQRLVELTQEKVDKGGIEVVISSLKTAYQDSGQPIWAMLRDFQLHFATFQKEQEEIVGQLQRLVARGKALQLEDLRQLEAISARRERKTDRELRREDLERLLAHFKQQRRRNGRQAQY